MEVEEIYHRTQTTFYLPERHTDSRIVRAKVAAAISRITPENMQAGFWRSISHYFYMKRWMISRRVSAARSKATTGMKSLVSPEQERYQQGGGAQMHRDRSNGGEALAHRPLQLFAEMRTITTGTCTCTVLCKAPKLVDIVFHLNDVSGKFPSNRNHRLDVGIEKHRSEREGEEHEESAERTLRAALEDFRPRRRRHVPVSGYRPHQSWRSGVQRGRSRLRSRVGWALFCRLCSSLPGETAVCLVVCELLHRFCKVAVRFRTAKSTGCGYSKNGHCAARNVL